jgi:hypothetical protein
MKITYLSGEIIQASPAEFNVYHVLTYAEEGFAPLNIHGEPRGLTRELLVRFADEVNRKRESGSLHPQAPISAVPRVYIRDLTDSAALSVQIIDFLRANAQTIHSKRMLFDFRTPHLAPYVITAIELAMRSSEADGVEEVIVATHS